MSCIYTLGNKQFETLDDLKEFIRTEGLGSLASETLSDKAQTVVAKYDFSKYEESAAEMIARLNYEREHKSAAPALTPEQVDRLIYPPGKLTDYMTQAQIHRNTYSGLRITGISANSGKMGGYMFESTPVKTLIDSRTSEVFQPSQATLRSKYGVESINELLDKHPYIKVHERELPTLKEGSQIKIDGAKYTQLVRFEEGTDTNIFELVDMIINLAIDNVKEQKLFVLGVTNSNANAFLSALFLGIPLRTIVRMFTTPTVAELSTKRFLTKSHYSDAAHTALQQLDTTAKAAKALDDFFEGNIPTKIIEKLGKGPKDRAAYIKVFADLAPSSKVLEDVYTKRASAELGALSDYLTLTQISKLATLGEEFFVYSQLFSLLRSLPSSKARIDYLATKIREYSEFSYLSGTETLISERMLASTKEIIEQSELYQNMLAVDPEQAQRLLLEQITEMRENPLFKNTVATRARQWFSNRVMRAQATLYLKPTSKSAFTNVTPLAIPHVYQAYKAMLTLNNILESGFFVYSPLVQKTVISVLKNIGKISDDTPKSAFYFSMLDDTAKELLKFLNSTNSVVVDGTTVSFDVAKLTGTASVRGVSYSGLEGWSQNLIKRLMALRNDNELIGNLEVIVDSNTGLSRLGITADKINDDEIRELLKASYEELLKTNKELALDLFKYAVMSQGLYYGRTSLGRIFPARLIVAFSQAMENTLRLIKGSSDVEMLANLQTIENQFTHQLIASNPENLPYVARQKPLQISATGKGVHKGMDMVEGKPVYYDLKYSKQAGNAYPKIIKRFGDKVYARLDVPTDSFVYYRIFAHSSVHNSYSFYPSDLSSVLALDRLLTPEHNVLYGVTTISDNTFEYAGEEIASAGGTVFIPVMKGNLPIALKEVEVTSTKPIIRGDVTAATRYTFVTKGEKTLLDEDKVKATQTLVLPLDLGSKESAVAMIPVDRLMRSKSKNRMVIASDTSAVKVDDQTFILPINELSGISGEPFNSLLDSTLQIINLMPTRARYSIQQGILEPLKITNLAAARQIALALFNTIGYVDPMIEDQQEFTTTDKLFAELDFILNKNEVLPKESFTLIGNDAIIVVDKLPFATRRKLSVGSMLKLGYSVNGTIYAYITDLNDTTASATVFGESTLRLVNKTILSSEEFEEILQKTQPC